MPKIAVVKSSELGNRWDAGFHVALQEVQTRVEDLRRTLSEDEVRRRLSLFSPAEKAPLHVLSRGEGRLDRPAIGRIERDYPYLSLAIMERNLAPAMAKLRERIGRDQARLEALLEIGTEPDDAAAPSP